MGSAEIAKTPDEMEAEMDVEMDAENGDVMDAKTTDEMINANDQVELPQGQCPSSQPRVSPSLDRAVEGV